jgi:hypothetical protein
MTQAARIWPCQSGCCCNCQVDHSGTFEKHRSDCSSGVIQMHTDSTCNVPGKVAQDQWPSNWLVLRRSVTPGSNAQSVADMPCGPGHTSQAPNALGTTSQTQLVLMDHFRVPDDMLVDQACGWHDTPVSAEGPSLPPCAVGHISLYSDASQGTGSAAAVMAPWNLFLTAYTHLTAAVALSCVRCGLSALV